MIKALSFTLLLLLLNSFGFSAKLFAQDEEWGGWIPVPQPAGLCDNQINVKISIKAGSCSGRNGYWRIDNESDLKEGLLQFIFRYEKCDGSTGTETSNVDLSKKGADKTSGEYFPGLNIVGQPYGVKLISSAKNNINIRLNSMYDNWSQQLADATARLTGYEGAGIEGAGSVLTEWTSTISDATEELKNLKSILDEICNKSMSDIQDVFNQFSKEQNNFQSKTSNYIAQLEALKKGKKEQKDAMGVYGKNQPTKTIGQKTTNSNQQNMTDDEKLNQAMMKKMEKDFEEKNKQKNNISPSENENAITKSNDNKITKSNESNDEIKRKTQEYKDQIIQQMNNYSFEYKGPGIVGGGLGVTYNKITYTNCHWEGNVFFYNVTEEWDARNGQHFNPTNKGRFDIDQCYSEIIYSSRSDCDKIIWTISGNAIIGALINLDNKEMIERLKSAFNYIIDNRYN